MRLQSASANRPIRDTNWQNVSPDQLKRLAPEGQNPVFKRLLAPDVEYGYTYPDTDGSSWTSPDTLIPIACGRAYQRERKESSDTRGAAIAGAVFGTLCLSGAALLRHSYWGLAAGALGGIFGAGAGFFAVNSWKASKNATLIEEQAKAAAQKLLQPGPDGTTFRDGGFYEAGKLTNLYESRSCASGDLLGRHAQIGGERPVTLEEDCQKGTVRITTVQGSREIEGQLILPTPWQRELKIVSQANLPKGDQAIQSFDAEGQSKFTYLAPQKSLSGSDEEYTFNLNNSVCWPNGVACELPDTETSTPTIYHPLVHCNELSASATVLPENQISKGGEKYCTLPNTFNYTRTTHSETSEVQLRKLEPGQIGEAQIGQLHSTLYNVNGAIQIAYDSEKEGLQLFSNGAPNRILDATIDVHGRLHFRSEDCPATQLLNGTEVELSVGYPEGRYKVSHQPGQEPTAEKFWGDNSCGSVEVQYREGQYLFEGHALQPPISPQELNLL